MRPDRNAGEILRAVFGHVSSLPLFWRVFGTNALVLTVAALALIFAPVTVSVPVAFTELVVLVIGLLVLLGLNLALLHSGVSLVRRAGRDDAPPRSAVPRRSGRTSTARRMSPMLAQTFNEMLDRLETERRESARGWRWSSGGERRRDRTRATSRGQ